LRLTNAMRIYAYLRASTAEQDALRAEKQLQDFIQSKDLNISTKFVENESGSTLARPELFKLLDIADSGDVLLVEQVDRLSRLNSKDWEKLKSIINEKGINIVSLDLPTSHMILDSNDISFTGDILKAVNRMLLDILAVTARKDYEDRRRRQAEGIIKARSEGKYKGRKADTSKDAAVALMLKDKKSYTDIQKALKVGKDRVARVKREMSNDSF